MKLQVERITDFYDMPLAACFSDVNDGTLYYGKVVTWDDEGVKWLFVRVDETDSGKTFNEVFSNRDVYSVILNAESTEITPKLIKENYYVSDECFDYRRDVLGQM